MITLNEIHEAVDSNVGGTYSGGVCGVDNAVYEIFRLIEPREVLISSMIRSLKQIKDRLRGDRLDCPCGEMYSTKDMDVYDLVCEALKLAKDSA